MTETALDCPVNCHWLWFSGNLCYCCCMLAIKIQGVLSEKYGGEVGSAEDDRTRKGSVAIALREPLELFLASDRYAAAGWLVLPSGCYEPHFLGLDVLFEKLNITHVLSEPDMEGYWRAKGLIVISKQAEERDNVP